MVASLFDQDDYVKALYYGDQGTRKTTNLATLAYLGKTIFVNAEGGLKRRPLQKLGIPIQNIVPVRGTSYDDFDQLYWQTKENLETHDVGDPARVVGVAFDSFTEIQKILLGVIVEKRVDKATKKNDTSDLSDEFYTGRDDYGRMTEQARRLTRRFRDLDCHVGFSALSKRDVEGDSVVYRPALTPAFCSDIMGYVDMVIYTNVVTTDDGREEGLGVMRPVDKYRGKDRYNATPTVLADPTFQRLVQLVNDEIDLDQDKAQQLYVERMLAAKQTPPPAETETEPTTKDEDTA